MQYCIYKLDNNYSLLHMALDPSIIYLLLYPLMDYDEDDMNDHAAV